MAQRERKLSHSINDALKKEGAFCFKVHGSEYMMAGLPDLIGCFAGRFFGFEVKNPENRRGTTPKQKMVGKMIEAAGGKWAVVCSPGEALLELRKMMAEEDDE